MIEDTRKQLDATRLKLKVLGLIMGSTTPPAKHSHRRTRLLFEIDLAIVASEYSQAIADLAEQRQAIEDLQIVLGSYRMSKAPTAQRSAELTPKPCNLRQAADAAQATCEALTADVALLTRAKDRGLLDPRTGERVRTGITRKCQSAIASLQLISDAMGGAE